MSDPFSGCAFLIRYKRGNRLVWTAWWHTFNHGPVPDFPTSTVFAEERGPRGFDVAMRQARKLNREELADQKDSFSGSATTAIACLRAHPPRRCLCIERDPKYAQLSRDRIQAELSSSTLQAHRAGQLPLLR